VTFAELDTMIRASVPDPIARKEILTGLHEIQEAVNQCAVWWLGVSGFTVEGEQYQREDRIYRKASKTRFQVND